MPIDMGVLGYQQRSARQGEIRIGDSVEVTRNGRTVRQPRRLWTFKFTAPTEAMVMAIAGLYGGEAVPWDRKEGYFAVVTPKSAIDVYVPVRGSVTDSMMELWDGPVRKRWCDGRTERMSGNACVCPRDRAEREKLSKLLHPEACRPRTKIGVTIPELPGLGQFQLSTGSVNALEETGDASRVMEAFRDEIGAWVPALLWIDRRQRVGDASPYPVPRLDIGASLVQLARHELPAGNDSLMRQLRAGGPQRAAIEAGGAPGEPAPEVSMLDDRDPLTAAQVAGLAARARSREDVEWLIQKAAGDGVDADMVNTDQDGPGNYMTLREHLRDVWRRLPKAGAA